MVDVKTILINNQIVVLYKFFKAFNDFCINEGINANEQTLNLFKEIMLKKNDKNIKSWETKQLTF